ncbi:MAG: hypothetical protein ACREEJ_16875, partial [Ensifer adhaerens]
AEDQEQPDADADDAILKARKPRRSGRFGKTHLIPRQLHSPRLRKRPVRFSRWYQKKSAREYIGRHAQAFGPNMVKAFGSKGCIPGEIWWS